MSATPIDPKITEAVVIDWRMGQLSQDDIADKHKISKGMVNKLCKGMAQDAKSTVTVGIQYNQALKNQDDRMVTAIEDTVSKQVQRMEWLNTAALKNASDAMKAPCDGQVDFKHRADTISKAKEVLVGKNPEIAVQVNTQLNSISLIEHEALSRRLMNEI
jgi:hypothetical protein